MSVRLAMLVSASLLISFNANATQFVCIATAAGVPPTLLLAVALVESGERVGEGIRPSPYVIRTSVRTLRPRTESAAREVLASLPPAERQTADVGPMQISVRWHGHSVAELADLLTPERNVQLGAQILRRALDSAPGDILTGVARYHTWSDRDRGRAYARLVLSVEKNLLKSMKGEPANESEC